MAARMRVLCWHGKCEKGEEFRELLAPLVEALPDMDFVFPNAAHPLDPGFAWWILPPGERSFTTTEFIGWDETLAYVRRLWEEQGPFDAVLGYSQGAILMTALASLGLLQVPTPSARMAAAVGGDVADALKPLPVQPTALLLFGSAPPGPFKKELAELAAAAGTETTNTTPRTLHVIGREDDINPPEGAYQVAKALGGDVLEHPGKHVIPLDAESVARYCAIIRGS